MVVSMQKQNKDKLTCLWCRLDSQSPKVTFDKKAHTIPQSLGGKFICEEICDTCNHYFVSPGVNIVAIEVVLREAFELTRHMVFTNDNKRSNHYGRSSHFFSS